MAVPSGRSPGAIAGPGRLVHGAAAPDPLVERGLRDAVLGRRRRPVAGPARLGWRHGRDPGAEGRRRLLVQLRATSCASGGQAASGRDASAHLRPRAERRGARPAGSGLARLGRLHGATRPDRAPERGGAPPARDRARPALRGADRAQWHPGVQRPRRRGPDGRLVAAQERRPGPRRGRAGAAARDPAPVAARLRPRPRHLDPRPPDPGSARGRAEPDRAVSRDGPAGAAAPGRGLEAGQALADQPRSRLRAKKRRRDRLIRLARGRPTWAFGFRDEVWFPRLAQPSLHAWAADERLRLATHAADPADREPKALACYGLWLPEPGRTMLRFVAGRPVSAVTRAFLAWVAGQLAAEGVRVLVL